MHFRTITKLLPVGAALFMLGTGSAHASDVTSDRAAAQARLARAAASATGVAAPETNGPGVEDRAQGGCAMGCCVARVEVPGAPAFGDHG